MQQLCVLERLASNCGQSHVRQVRQQICWWPIRMVLRWHSRRNSSNCLEKRAFSCWTIPSVTHWCWLWWSTMGGCLLRWSAEWVWVTSSSDTCLWRSTWRTFKREPLQSFAPHLALVIWGLLRRMMVSSTTSAGGNLDSHLVSFFQLLLSTPVAQVHHPRPDPSARSTNHRQAASQQLLQPNPASAKSLLTEINLIVVAPKRLRCSCHHPNVIYRCLFLLFLFEINRFIRKIFPFIEIIL